MRLLDYANLSERCPLAPVFGLVMLVEPVDEVAAPAEVVYWRIANLVRVWVSSGWLPRAVGELFGRHFPCPPWQAASGPGLNILGRPMLVPIS